MKPAAGAPWRPLAALTAGVLAVHWLALRGAPEVLSWGRPGPAPRVLHTVAPIVNAPAPAAAVASPSAAPATPVAAPAVVKRAAQPAAPAKPPARAATPAGRGGPVASAQATGPVIRLPAAAQWHYAATALHRGVVLRGTAQLAWRPAGGEYEAVLQVNVPPLPARLQRSVGAITPEGLAPARFSDRTRSEEATHFDRGQGRIVFSSNRPETALQLGAQDRVSVLLQLAAIAAGDPARLSAGTVVALQTAGTREAERWEFVVEGAQDLDLPGGSASAIKLTRSPQREYDLRLEVWLGPGPDYAPVRLRLTPPNGDWLDMQWSGTDKR
jgi:hypothetical protein